MLCGSMIRIPSQGIVPCGQCINCRINRKRKLVSQLIMEQLSCENLSSFVTLTYAPENLPDGGSLAPADMARFINRLRDRDSGLGPVRYFYVGEYGERTQRPHYHMALFNVDPERAETAANKLWTVGKRPIGHVHVGEITDKSISYISGYCLKKMGRNDIRLAGRYPEFGRRSKFPPLGAKFYDRGILPAMRSERGQASLRRHGTTPSTFRYENRRLPLPDYWRKALMAEMGVKAPNPADEWSVDITKYVEFTDAQKKATQWLHTKGERVYKSHADRRPL